MAKSKTTALEALFKQNPMLAKGVIYQAAAEKSLYEFMKLMWEYIEPGRKFRNARHAQAICEHLEAVSHGQIKKLLINIPPGFAKSIISNVFWPAWEWIHWPHMRYLTLSYASSLTERDNGRFSTLVSSDLYRTLWGDRFILIKDNSIKVENNKTGWKLASSVGGVGTGERANRIICLTEKSMIQTNRGLISIGEIVDKKLDILIAGYDEENIKWQRIESWQKNPFRPLVEIHFDGGSIKCTEGHRVYTQRGWVPASEITTEDNLWSGSSEAMQFLPWKASWSSKRKNALEKRVVISVKKISEIHEYTYNLSVHPCHNFFADGILVKNCDDLNNIKDVESKVTRDETNRYYMEVLPSRVIDPNESVFINIQQRSNEDDVSGLILSRDMGYEHLCLPFEFDPDRKCYTSIGWEDWRTEPGELLWPEVYDQEAVNRLKSDTDMSSYAYAGQYQQSPAPRGGGIIKSAWWKLYPKQGEIFDEYGNPVRPLEFPEMDFIIGSVDGAFGEKEQNDYSAMAVFGVYREEGQPKVMLMYAWQKKYRFHGTVPERRKGESQKQYLEREEWGLVERVTYTCHILNVDRLIIENKASGISLGQEIRRLYANEKFGVELINPKGDKIARAHSVSHLFENGVISAPNREWATLAIDECSKFPKGHDDLPDCIFQALIWLRKMGWALRVNEYEDEIEPQEFRGNGNSALYDV